MKASIDLYSLSQNLNNLCEFLHDTYDINNGGCCYASYLISENLEKLGIKYSVVILDVEVDVNNINEDEVILAIKKRQKHKLFSGFQVGNHYALKIEDEIVNPSIMLDCSDDLFETDELNSKDLKWIYDTGDWNEVYNIARNRFIKIFIDTFFKTVKLQLL